jgi:hypothetical protein
MEAAEDQKALLARVPHSETAVRSTDGAELPTIIAEPAVTQHSAPALAAALRPKRLQ